MILYPLSKTCKEKLQKYSLNKKFTKQIELLFKNPRHTSLNVELLEPKKFKIYSFRIDRKYRALFIYRKTENAIEIITITKHYE